MKAALKELQRREEKKKQKGKGGSAPKIIASAETEREKTKAEHQAAPKNAGVSAGQRRIKAEKQRRDDSAQRKPALFPKQTVEREPQKAGVQPADCEQMRNAVFPVEIVEVLAERVLVAE